MSSGLWRDREEVALVGESAVMTALRAELEIAARSQAKVLVTGETGVGKEVVARLIHQTGARRSRRFVAINCSGVPETLLESELFGHTRGSFTGAYRDKPGLVRLADGGTLFLDELGEMSLRMQAVLLRFAETGEVQPVGADGPMGHTDVRLITATHRNLRAQIDSNAFREDLSLPAQRDSGPRSRSSRPWRRCPFDASLLLATRERSACASTPDIDARRGAPFVEPPLARERPGAEERG